MDHSCGCGCRTGGKSTSVQAAGGRALRAEDTVESAGRRSPDRLAILQRFGIDTCCGGHLTLAQAAAGAGVPVETLLRALDPVTTTT